MAFRRQYPHAELRIPTVPNFPLSSPITEEVASPTSSSSDERDPERTRPFEYLSKVPSRNPFVRRAEYEGRSESNQLETSSYGFQNGHQNGESGPKPLATRNSSERPVGLNLVTDFSSHSNVQEKTAQSPLVDLDDLKMLAEKRETERTTQRLKGILKKDTNHGFYRLSEDYSNATRRRSSWVDMTPRISPKKKYKDELSPSDRPIMIGFSMPFESPDSQKEKPRELDIADSQRTPLTPSIVVTPAREDGFWSSLSPEHHRPRATSSIYSQPTPSWEHSDTPVPPVPAIPAQHAAAKNEVLSPKSPRRQSLASTRKHRSFSAGTVFEEDEVSRPGTRSRSYSTSSVKRAFDRLSGIDGVSRLSVNTEHDRHQSQGWWTYLLSPLLGRSSTMTSRKTLIEDRPPVPAIKTNLSESSDEWWEKEVSCFSPETPETAGVTRGEVASWQNNDTNPFADFNSITDPQAEPLGERNATSFMFPGRAIQGSAAEYYQACAHELFSSRPYFECVDHVCSITPQDMIPVAEPDAVADDTLNEKGLLVDVDDMPRSQPQDDRSSLAPTSVSKTCSCGASAAAAGESEGLNRSPKEDGPPMGSASETSRAGSPEPRARGSVPDASDDNTPIESSPEPSRHSSPDPEPQPRGMEGPPPADSEYEKQQSFNPFVQQAPAAAAPPPVHVYIQQAPQQAAAPIQAPPPVITTERMIPQYVMIPPPHNQEQPPQPQRPDPVSPGFQRASEAPGSIPLSEVENSPAPAYTSSPATLPPRVEPAPVTREVTTNPFAERGRIESRRRRHEKEEAIGKKAGGLWRGRGCISSKGCFGRSGREGRLKRRWYMAIAAFFLAIVIVAIVLAIVLTRKGDATPVESQWLNLTGYPPMPTGIATVAAPEPKVQNSGCITPASLWSCALPKEQQDTNEPYPANQPNFRVEIQFRNGTYPNSTTVASDKSKRTPGSFDPSPAPPDMKEQAFLGNTTDNNTAPYAGEETPFYMTILSPVPFSKNQHARRSDKSDNAFPDLESLIPSPDVESDGTAAAANLYPLPESQPVRLYNRGQDTEHYGFYTYFDRSIFLSSTTPLDGRRSDPKADDNGGSSKTKARTRCTWAQTRFLVQIWTKPERSGKTLLSSNSTSASASASPSPISTSTSTTQSQPTSTSNSSAIDFTRPGSFPYPITLTLDRHGGDAQKKMLYCYGLESDLHINTTAKKLQLENRDFAGRIVNSAPGIFNTTGSESKSSSSEDKGKEKDGDELGGFDGGSGGCSCQWGNWISKS